MASMMWRRLLPASQRLGPVGPKHFVATHELLAAAVEPAADDLLGPADGGPVAAERIHVGGVEERDAALGGPIHDRDGSRFVALEPERHRPETDARDLEAGAAESNVLHAAILPSWPP